MKITKPALIIIAACATTAAVAQAPEFHDPLVDHLAGKWVLQGTLAGKTTTHDLDAHWVIQHHYLLLHEVSREKNKKGEPEYEANVYITWNGAQKEYGCVWLDVYGGVSPVSLGTGKTEENKIPFVFKDKDSTFHTVFAYSPKDDTWTMNMDSEDKGKLSPFGRMTLKRG
jgi:hypothetical protein